MIIYRARRRMLRALSILLIGCGLWPNSLTAQDFPTVVVTLRPFHSIAAAVMEGAGEPVLLLSAGAATPHGHGLKPSEMRMLSGADLVIWGGPGLEAFLRGPMESLPDRVVRLALVKALAVQVAAGGPGVVRRRRPLLVWPGTGDVVPVAAGPLRLAEIDHHVWLDPMNAKTIAHILARRLSAMDPGRARIYRGNAVRFARRMGALDASLAARLKPVAGRRFIVFHDSYLYFERRYGLSALAAVTQGHEAAPGTRHVAGLRKLTMGGAVACVFVEPQFEPQLARALVQGTRVRSRSLDPLGARLAPGPDLYSELMRRLADAVVGCLE